MTIEERIKDLEASIAALRLDIEDMPKLKFEVGDAVFVDAKIESVDHNKSVKLPYLVIVDGEKIWVPESTVHPKVSP